MKLEIVSPDGILFEGETESVSFPGVAGSFDILPHHAPLIAALKAGTIRSPPGSFLRCIIGGWNEHRKYRSSNFN